MTIIIVDDDPKSLDAAQKILRTAGFATKGFQQPEDALTFLRNHKVSLVISDVMMPTIDGFSFFEEVQRLFGDQRPPFLFWSGKDEPDFVVRGLNMEADDYLIKPIHPAVLVAKVRNILARKQREARPSFTGDLASLSLVELMKYCEKLGLTGKVTVTTDRGTFNFEFVNGHWQKGKSEVPEEIMITLCGERKGRFEIFQKKINEPSLPFMSRQKRIREKSPETSVPCAPMGKVSGVKVGRRIFHIQSEIISDPTPAIVTLAIFKGKVLRKKVVPLENCDDPQKAETILLETHSSVENDIKEKIITHLNVKSTTSPSKDDPHDLFEQGLVCYYAGDQPGALSLWKQAIILDPDNPILRYNIELLEEKLRSQHTNDS